MRLLKLCIHICISCLFDLKKLVINLAEYFVQEKSDFWITIIVNSKNHQSTKANCGAEKLYDQSQVNFIIKLKRIFFKLCDIFNTF